MSEYYNPDALIVDEQKTTPNIVDHDFFPNSYENLYNECNQKYILVCEENKELISIREKLINDIANSHNENQTLEQQLLAMNERIANEETDSQTDNLAQCENKINELVQTLDIEQEKRNRTEQAMSVLKCKYEFILSECERLTGELFNTQIYSNNKSLMKQNAILLEDNTNLTNELYDTKKQLHNLTQQLKFIDIEHKLLLEYHDKFKKDTTQRIYDLKTNFGLLADDAKRNVDNTTDEEEEEEEEEDEVEEDADEELNLLKKVPLRVFIDNNGVKKLLVNGKHYKMKNQNIDVKNGTEVQKEYDVLYNTYVVKKK